MGDPQLQVIPPGAWVPSEDGRAFATVMGAQNAVVAGDSREAERLFREGIRLYREGGDGVDDALVAMSLAPPLDPG